MGACAVLARATLPPAPLRVNHTPVACPHARRIDEPSLELPIFDSQRNRSARSAQPARSAPGRQRVTPHPLESHSIDERWMAPVFGRGAELWPRCRTLVRAATKNVTAAGPPRIERHARGHSANSFSRVMLKDGWVTCRWGMEASPSWHVGCTEYGATRNVGPSPTSQRSECPEGVSGPTANVREKDKYI